AGSARAARRRSLLRQLPEVLAGARALLEKPVDLLGCGAVLLERLAVALVEEVEKGGLVGRVFLARRSHLRQRDGAQLRAGGAVTVLRAVQFGEARVARGAQAHVTRVRVGVGAAEHLAVRVGGVRSEERRVGR